MRVILVIPSLLALAAVKSTAVGMIGKRAVTSREVQIQRLIGLALVEPVPKTDLERLPTLDSRAFARDVADVLLEGAVALEAQSFNLMQISSDDVSRAKRRVVKALAKSVAWATLHVDPREFDQGLRRKLQAQKFIAFRAESSTMPVTDVEVQRAYDENRAKYGVLPFENAREEIRSSLAKAQTDKRLKDWFDGLLSKYQVKNLIAEM